MATIINILLLFYFASLPYGQLTKVPLGIPEVNLYLTDIFAGLLGFTAIFAIKKRNLAKLSQPFFIFLLIALVSLLVNSPRLQLKEFMVAGLYFIRLLAYFGLFLVAYKYQKLHQYENYLIAVGSVIAVFGLIQYLFLPDIGFLESFGFDPHYYRLVGTFLDPGFTGIILVLTLILLFKSRLKSIRYPLYAIGYLALALTYSRASYLAFLAAVIVIFVKKKAFKLLTAIILLVLVTVMILPRGSGGESVKLERISTFNARIGSWRNALLIAGRYPVFGVGFNAYRYAQREAGLLGEGWQASHAAAGADSSLLFILATTGIVGLVSFLWLWFKILKAASKKSVFVLAALIAVLIHSWFLNTLFYPAVLGYLAFILALV